MPGLLSARLLSYTTGLAMQHFTEIATDCPI